MWRSFYAETPSRAIALDELEEAGLLRVRVLHALTAVQSAERLFRSVHDLPQPARDALHRLNADADLDSVSHFSLRLAFSIDRDRLEWLLDYEVRLMRFRLRHLPPDDIMRLLQACGQNIRVVGTEQIQFMVSREQQQWLQLIHQPSSRFCLVPFNVASRLVGPREVLLIRGQCMVHVDHLYHVAVDCFKVILRVQLLALNRSLPAKRRAMERLKDVINRIHLDSMRTQSSHNQFVCNRRPATVVNLANIDDIAQKHFPMCMRHLHMKLRENHHLKFDGRVQYRIFLKGLGFSVHDSIQFFRNEFTRIIPAAKFDREYAYHIRHSYGLEGSRKDYAPMNCQNIIHGGAPKHGQFHGCPFKHWDSETLQQELRRMNVALPQREEISQTASRGFHEQACATLFEVLHRRPFRSSGRIGGDELEARMHPNEWVHASLS